VIWIPETVRSPSTLSAYIKDYLLRQGLLSGSVDAHCIDDLSHALSAYLEASSDRAGFFVEDGNLLVLASRALQSVGQGKAATRMLMLGSGFARPVSWLVTEQDAGWTIDVARISEEAAGGLEIVFFRCLNAAIEALAETWHAHGGQVVVVLQGATEAGSVLLGRPAHARQVQAFVKEVDVACRDKLAQLARQYGWKEPPQLFKGSFAARR
jgi:hypothetical protein